MSTDDLQKRFELTLHDVIVDETGGCTCADAYTLRMRIDPACSYHCVPAPRLMAEALMPLVRQAQEQAFDWGYRKATGKPRANTPNPYSRRG